MIAAEFSAAMTTAAANMGIPIIGSMELIKARDEE
jgi:hypothetical protein